MGGGCGRVCSVRSCLLPSFVNVMAALNTFRSCAGLRGHEPRLSGGVNGVECMYAGGVRGYSWVINRLLRFSQKKIRAAGQQQKLVKSCSPVPKPSASVSPL